MRALVIRQLMTIAATVILGGFLCAIFVRVAPGFDVDMQQLDGRLSAQTVEALRAKRQSSRNILAFYGQYMRNALHGNFGKSLVSDHSVRQLIAERLPATIQIAGGGLALAWLIAFSLAMAVAVLRSRAADMFAMSAASLFLALPAAVIGLACVFADAPPLLAIAAIVSARLFPYVRSVLTRTGNMPHVLAARARGAGELRILFMHVLPVAAQPLLAIIGISVAIALGADIPVEALCGIPGIGQLAWQAALGRDLPVIVTLTVLVTIITVTLNSACDVAAEAARGQHA